MRLFLSSDHQTWKTNSFFRESLRGLVSKDVLITALHNITSWYILHTGNWYEFIFLRVHGLTTNLKTDQRHNIRIAGIDMSTGSIPPKIFSFYKIYNKTIDFVYRMGLIVFTIGTKVIQDGIINIKQKQLGRKLIFSLHFFLSSSLPSPIQINNVGPSK